MVFDRYTDLLERIKGAEKSRRYRLRRCPFTKIETEVKQEDLLSNLHYKNQIKQLFKIGINTLQVSGDADVDAIQFTTKTV